MASYPPLLKEILESARLQKSLGEPVQGIFDLDSTLFDVSPRITKILHSFAALPVIKSAYPSEAALIAQIEPHVKDYGVRRTLARYNFTLPNQEFGKILVAYWKKHFFSNEYLHFDLPYPGASKFVNQLKE